MLRTEITAAVVAEVERQLAEGRRRAKIAADLGISEYVVRIIAQSNAGPTKPPAIVRRGSRVPNSQRGIDAITIRRIQRMLAVGILPPGEIAREAGVSANTITDVARGKRRAITMIRPHMEPGERFLREPVRCTGCHALISVVPCRACRAVRGETDVRHAVVTPTLNTS